MSVAGEIQQLSAKSGSINLAHITVLCVYENDHFVKLYILNFSNV